MRFKLLGQDLKLLFLPGHWNFFFPLKYKSVHDAPCLKSYGGSSITKHKKEELI